MNFRKNFQAKLSLGTIDVGLISFISPEVLASLDLHQTMFKKGNLTFQFMKREPRTKDYDVLACCVTSYVDLMNMLRKTGIMVSSGGIKKVLKKELQEDFELYLINHCTLNEFIDLVDTHIREIEATLSEKTCQMSFSSLLVNFYKNIVLIKSMHTPISVVFRAKKQLGYQIYLWR